MLSCAAAELWLYRRDVEIEAASLFQSMAESMRDFSWPGILIDSALQAAKDEVHHAVMCQGLVSTLDPGREFHEMPKCRSYHFENEDALLYTAVSVGCVTESMSSALLLRMRETTTHEECQKVVQKVLKDEIGHSRIGWESLRYCLSNRSARWLHDSLPLMCQRARTGQMEEPVSDEDLSSFGILSHSEANAILQQTQEQVILPGIHSLLH